MKKDIEWLKREVKKLEDKANKRNQFGSEYTDEEVALEDVKKLINQLDDPEVNSQIDKLANFIMSEVEGEPIRNQGAVDTAIRIIKSYQNQETLSQEWIDKNVVHVRGLGDVIEAEAVENLLVPKQEVLTQEWIDEHRESTFDLDEDFETVFIRVENLQNLLVPEWELPVIPKFVAEWIEDYKEREDIYTAISNAFEGVESTEMYNWVSGYTGVANQETFARAWLDGYEVEEEQKYYVLNNEKYFLLGKDKGHGFIFSTGGNSKLGSTGRTSATFELTEQEIKGYDPRYMAFAKPVEELEE